MQVKHCPMLTSNKLILSPCFYGLFLFLAPLSSNFWQREAPLERGIKVGMLMS